MARPVCPRHSEAELIRLSRGWFCEVCNRIVVTIEATTPRN